MKITNYFRWIPRQLPLPDQRPVPPQPRPEWHAHAALLRRRRRAVVPAPRGRYPQRHADDPGPAPERVQPQQQRSTWQPSLTGRAWRQILAAKLGPKIKIS